MIIGWIRTSIDPKIRSTVTFVPEASTLWDNLEKRFSVQNGEELDTIKTSRSCMCEASADIAKEREDVRVHKFLFGLDESRFRNIRSQIIDEDPLPDMNNVYSRVIREEQHNHKARAQEVKMETAIGFTVQSELLKEETARAAAAVFRTRDPNRFCTHCSRKGHDNSECFLLHGYPDWWYEQQQHGAQSQRGRGGRTSNTSSRGRGRGNMTRANNTTASSTVGWSPEQLAQLIQLLQTPRSTITSEKLTGNPAHGDVIIDTGASHHMTGNLSIIFDVVDITPSSVIFPDGNTSRAVKSGKLTLSRDYYLTDSKKLSQSELWHWRLGHPSYRILSSLPTLHNFSFDSDQASACEICFRAKQSRGVFRDSSNKASEPFSLIHCDVWGPYCTLSSCGAAYFLTVVDDYSRAVWTYLILEKSKVANLLKEFFAHTERQFGTKVKKIRTDNRTEFMVLSSSSVNKGESVLTAAHLINYTPTKVLDGKSLYEVLFGAPPAYDQLRVFGCLCFPHCRSRDKDKFGDRSRRCIFVGYPYGKKAWLLYDLESNEFLSSRDVVFSEDVFPGVDNPNYVSPPLNTYDPTIDDWLLLNVITSESSPVPSPHPPTTLVSVDTPSPSSPLATPSASPNDATVSSPGLPEILGKGLRLKTPSVLLKDYITHSAHLDNNKPIHVLSSPARGPPQTSSGNIMYPIANYVSDSHFSASHRAFVAAILSSHPHTHYSEAVKEKVWRDAMTKEIDALDESETWDITSLPPGKKAIGTMWIYTNKFRSDGTLERHKVRLVALGNNQEAGEDFTETFAPVAKHTTVRFFYA
ncbi:unnamed protein product [Microthlaspi erraticum]|uniref:Integrase catalytic domain-containing protein n=1 Tax=Microthlaspi erraticum TaxID=1685480 RepID=A0A6D2KQZ7_9BRAS|nr:unnamed protein product [Microthlaspi erraticum]